ncbi:hypothetical protein ANCCAN_09188 [Ancylostoma caninum]|uniref:Uncharacterized protein n=1 Tax=Ancylostoma caninum TaxID=29170 RepID=A0A368GKF3_ANCCA|nr:hypothetical protein ANCCAN_09188 [Ancylostoma caninum]
MFLVTSKFPYSGFCSSDSLTDLHKAMKEKRKEVAHDVIAKVINESIPYATDAPQPALAEYETFHQNKKVGIWMFLLIATEVLTW